jgi:uncharacterized lipoprotein YbaY
MQGRIDGQAGKGEHRSMGFLGRLCHAALIAAVLVYAGCSRAPAQISGTAAFDQAPPPPPDAVLEVTLQELGTGRTATTIGVTRVAALKASPAEFVLPYDAGRVAGDRDYAVQARLVSGDVVLATSGLQPVLTGGHGTAVTLTLRQAESGLAAAPLLKGMFAREGDRPRFTPCGQRDAIAVDTGGDFAALNAAYLGARRSSGEALLARVEGSTGGEPPALTVTRFISIAIDQTCDSP